MNQFWKMTFAVVVGSFLYSIFVSILWFFTMLNISLIMPKEPEIKKNSVLVIDLKSPIVEHISTENPWQVLQLKKQKTVEIYDAIKAIEYAKTDPHIKGIVLKSFVKSTGWAQLQELRNALKDFKESGKFIYAYTDIMTQPTYYIMSVADKIFITPKGQFEWRGLASVLLYYKKFLDKFNINVFAYRHGAYKSAAEPFIADTISPENSEQLSLILDRYWKKMLNDIANDRQLDPNTLDQLAANLTIETPYHAVKYNLVDAQIYYDQFLDSIKTLLGLEPKEKIKSIGLADYISAIDIEQPTTTDKIAIIYAQGNIVDLDDGSGNKIVGEKLAKLIRKARTNDKIKAVVLRVNSPGGSALASEIIWREVKKTAEVKPIVVSMSNVAASGGYYISCAATKIVADDFTITGSIGVLAVLFNLQDFLKEKIGFTVSVVKTHQNADLNPLLVHMSPQQQNYIKDIIDSIYITFLNRVADGRNMTVEQVRKIAEGRVWSGYDAMNIGLVDTLGGLMDAVKLAAQLADLEKYKIVEYPKPKTFLEAFLQQPSIIFKQKQNQIYNLDDKLLEQISFIRYIAQQNNIWTYMPYYIEIR